MKVGIITMHKPLSYGSALQAYALQKTIEDMGFEAEIIDYKYPNAIHKIGISKFDSFYKSSISFALNALFGFPNISKRLRFKKFWSHYYKLSKPYPTPESLTSAPPQYDIYMTGSDQVWNSNFTKSDSSFLLSFAPEESRKYAYSSSFAISYVPEQYSEMYKRCLSHYSGISVREKSGEQLIKSLTGFEAYTVCDPTLLISADQWNEMISDDVPIVSEPYILAFILTYSFNPYPYVQKVIDDCQKRLGCKVVYLDGSKNDFLKPNSKVIKNAGPLEFLNLVKHARLVISSSFHGVIFSALFHVPFLGIVDKHQSDSRIISILEKIGLESRAVQYDSDFCAEDIIVDYPTDGIAEFRGYSYNILKHFLSEV